MKGGISSAVAEENIQLQCMCNLFSLLGILIGMTCRARDILQGVAMVGLDVEWKPNTSGEQNPASILQVCLNLGLDSLYAAANCSDLQACLSTTIFKVLLSTCIVADDTAQSIKQCCCG